MHNINPDDLDAILRDGAESHEYTYTEAAWNTMAAKLDQRDRKRRLLIWLVSGLITITVASWLLMSNNSESSNKTTALEIKKIAAQTAASNNEEAASQALVASQNTEIHGSRAISNSKASIKTESGLQTSNNVISKQQIGNSQASISPNSNFKSKSKTIIPPSLANQEGQNLPTALVEKALNGTSLLTSAELSNTPRFDSRSSIATAALDKVTRAVLIDTRFYFTGQYADIPSRGLLAMSRNSFVFGVQAGSEWSSVGGMGETATMGWKVAVFAGVPLSDHFELTLGAGISKKKYGSSGSEYEPEGGWVDNIEPMTMQSKCHIVDVPVNFTYYPHGRLKDGFFAEAGISSYFFSSEWYGFDYDPADKALLLSKEIEPLEDLLVEDVNRNIASIANIAVGFQKRLSDGTQIQFTPYAQIPLAGVGSGKVNLFTSGIRLTAKFSR